MHITDTLTKKVDVYDGFGNFIRTYPSRVAVATWLNVSPSSISSAISNAAHDKGSQVKGYWLCHHKGSPGYRNTNTSAYKQAAKQRGYNARGTKRPNQSNFMKQYNKCRADTTIYTFIHKSGDTFTGTRNQLIEKYPSSTINNSELGVMIRGNYQSHRGWSLTTL